MTENMKTFMENVSKNKELNERMKSITDKAELIATAKELGFELTEEDFKVPEGELSETELNAVAGGGECYCAVGGGGTADKYGHVCACVACGIGANHLDDDQDRCFCAIGGYGHDLT